MLLRLEHLSRDLRKSSNDADDRGSAVAALVELVLVLEIIEDGEIDGEGDVFLLLLFLLMIFEHGEEFCDDGQFD